jgi:hypothetical protein
LQSDALKTLLGIPRALGVSDAAMIESHGARHSVAVRIDPGGTVVVVHERESSPRMVGTSVSVPLPVELGVDLGRWARNCAIVNPHAVIDHGQSSSRRRRGGFYMPSVEGAWRKPLPTDRTSPHWYDEAALRRLVFAHIGDARSAGRDLPIGEFIRQFGGPSSAAKAKLVTTAVPAIGHLSDFEGAVATIAVLLAAMCEHARRSSVASRRSITGLRLMRGLVSSASGSSASALSETGCRGCWRSRLPLPSGPVRSSMRPTTRPGG